MGKRECRTAGAAVVITAECVKFVWATDSAQELGCVCVCARVWKRGRGGEKEQRSL